MWIITIIEDLSMVNYDYHLERLYGKSSTILRLILHERRMIVHESLYDCTRFVAVIIVDLIPIILTQIYTTYCY